MSPQEPPHPPPACTITQMVDVDTLQYTNEVDVDDLDAELAATNHTTTEDNLGTTKHTDVSYHNPYALLGKDLVWNQVGLKLMDKKTGNVKLNILKVNKSTMRVELCYFLTTTTYYFYIILYLTL
jgi:hypothetical protein